MTNTTRYQSPYEISRSLSGSAGFNRNDVGWDILITHLASNTVGYGIGVDPRLDITDSRVWQQASSGAYLGRIIPAADPLFHPDFQSNKIGSVVGFCIRVVQHLPLNRRILIIPNSFGGLGYADATWQSGGALFTDTVNRVNALMAANPRNRVLGFFSYIHGGNDVPLWEANAGTSYKAAVRAQMDAFRAQITGAASAPFLFGGFPDTSATNGSTRQLMHNYLRDGLTVERPRVAYFSTTGATAEGDNLHYNPFGHRDLANRAYEAFKKFL